MKAAIAETVRELRIKNKLSQEKLAEAIDSHQVYISEIEQGKKLPSIEHLYKISVAFNMKLSELIKIAEEKKTCKPG